MNQVGLFEAVRELLFYEWDPIGVNDNPQCRDEYDGYAPAIVRLLLEDADEHKILEHLMQCERVNMGLVQTDDAHDLLVTRQLMNLVQKP